MTWEGARRNGLVQGSQMSLAEKIAWLESADRAVESLKTARAKPAARIDTRAR